MRGERTEPDLLTEEQLTEGLLRKGAAVGFFPNRQVIVRRLNLILLPHNNHFALMLETR